MSIQTASQDYELLAQVLTDGDIPVSLYANKITGELILLTMMI